MHDPAGPRRGASGPALVRWGLLLAVGAAIAALERRRPARRYVEPREVHTGRNLAIAGLAAATVQLVEVPVVVPLARYVTLRRWGLVHRLGGPPWLRAAVAVLLLDYTLYLWHILTHRVPWLWRFHLVHHVDVDLDASTALRFHAGELATSVPWRAAQVALIGVSPGVLAAWQTLTLVAIGFHHSNTRLSGPAERLLSWLVTTPRMHAIHHSVEPAQLQSNFSSGLAIWDRLHGTARFDTQAADVVVGVDGYLEPDALSLPHLLRLPFEAPRGASGPAADATDSARGVQPAP